MGNAYPDKYVGQPALQFQYLVGVSQRLKRTAFGEWVAILEIAGTTVGMDRLQIGVMSPNAAIRNAKRAITYPELNSESNSGIHMEVEEADAVSWSSRKSQDRCLKWYD